MNGLLRTPIRLKIRSDYTMKMILLKCPECSATFSIDQEAVGDDDVVVCPTCEGEVDVEDDVLVVR